MARTYFFDGETADGKQITVEYSASGGESHYDNPGHICDGGGSGPEIEIVSATLRQVIVDPNGLDVEVGELIQLTDEEDERLCGLIAENFVDDDYDDYGWDNNYI